MDDGIVKEARTAVAETWKSGSSKHQTEFKHFDWNCLSHVHSWDSGNALSFTAHRAHPDAGRSRRSSAWLVSIHHSLLELQWVAVSLEFHTLEQNFLQEWETTGEDRKVSHPQSPSAPPGVEVDHVNLAGESLVRRVHSPLLRIGIRKGVRDWMGPSSFMGCTMYTQVGLPSFSLCTQRPPLIRKLVFVSQLQVSYQHVNTFF